jgi:signal transduction histidine kinase
MSTPDSGSEEMQPGVYSPNFECRETEEIMVDLSGRLINAQEEERARIARELHDDLSQKMALLSIEIEQLTQLPSQAVPEIQTGLRKILNGVQEVSAAMHRMSSELHPSKLDRLGLAAATSSLCMEISNRRNLQIDCKFKDVPGSLPRDISLCLYRVIQESLQNVINHSGAGSASVHLQGSPSEIRLRVTDDGVGFRFHSVKRKRGLGLPSMQERLRLVGGTMSIESQPMHGAQITAAIPLRAPDPEIKKRINHQIK